MNLVGLEHPSCEAHEMGPQHPERPERLKVIKQAIQSSSLNKQITWRHAQAIQQEYLKLAHDATYIQSLFDQRPKDGYVALDADTIMNPHTLEAALHAAGALKQAVDIVLNNEATCVYCHIRPPGHHAEHNSAMGFCFFSNVAVGAKYALEVKHVSRVAIIDFDVHHGNGTHDIIEHDPRIFFCSSFEYPLYPGTHLNTNAHIIHAPLPAGTDGASWRTLVSSWFNELEKFNPDIIFVSAGFDAHQADFLANIKLRTEDYAWIGHQIACLAKKTCQKVIVALEGGYALEAIAESCVAFLQALTSHEV